MASTNGKLLTLALGISLGATACDEVERPSIDAEMTVRSGEHRNGGNLTLNTNKWVSSAARDVYEFTGNGASFINSFGYTTQLTTITVTDPTPSGYGLVTTDVGETHATAWAEVLDVDKFTIRIHGPTAGDPVVDVTEADLIGLKLGFDVMDIHDNEYTVVLKATAHVSDALAGDLFDFYKVDPDDTDSLLAPLCEESEAGGRAARITRGISIDGDTGALDDSIDAGLRHFGCCASAPAKAVKLGYGHTVTDVATFDAATRLVRADYCGDGHPYTFPGNMVGTEDNLADPTEDPNTTLTNVIDGLAAGEVLEAVWDEYGVLCIDTPRAANVVVSDIICPTKQHADGTLSHNWRPPSCSSFTDVGADPAGLLRIYSKTADLSAE